MLDGLLGKTELKERIAELEAECERLEGECDQLEAQLQAEDDRRAAAVTDRQAAEEEVNQLQDRITELEHRVDSQSTGDSTVSVHEEVLRGDRVSEVLDRVASFEGGRETVLSAYVEGEIPDVVRDVLGDRIDVVETARPCLVVVDDAGVLSVAVRPVVPPTPFCEWSRTATFEREWFMPSGQFTVAVVRADMFAAGTYTGTDREKFTGFTSHVKSEHSKGGYSQGRFERIRDEQIDDHVEKCREALQGFSHPVYLLGDQRLITRLSDTATVTDPVSASGDPEDALREAFAEFWSVRLYRL